MARSKSTRPSYCLRHQEREAVARCAACMKPLCQECTLSTDLGTFCGSDCYDKRVSSNERVEMLKREDDAQKIPRLIRSLLSWAFTILLLVGLFVLWQHLPAAWRAPIENLYKSTPTPKRH